MIIATAGHVDHGKTTLIEAITGVNADRLPEEKRRGMTIDLGYAYWPQPDGRVPGFIDVPGHEKFLSNMLAGVGGIDHALLVVACDDGVMAQTREHLAILQLTGNPALTVALTKADRVDEARINEVREEVEQTLREFGYPQATLFVTAAAGMRGIHALRAHLLQLPERAHPEHQRFRLALDRAFTVKGAGWWSPARRSLAMSVSAIRCGSPALISRCACAVCMRRINPLSMPTPGSALR